MARSPIWRRICRRDTRCHYVDRYGQNIACEPLPGLATLQNWQDELRPDSWQGQSNSWSWYIHDSSMTEDPVAFVRNREASQRWNRERRGRSGTVWYGE